MSRRRGVSPRAKKADVAPNRTGGWSTERLVIGLIVVSVFAAYQPVWQGEFLWDDSGHVTKPELRSFHGLIRIWTELGAAQQYYPLTHTVFWILHRLFGDAPTGYHLVTIGLHALTSGLLFAFLSHLRVPGALLAASVFALHPVHVESVAWISEIKNTLSGVFFVAAALAWLRFDSSRRWQPYAVALVLFVLALLSKTVTASWPAAMAVVLWWKRGTLRWREDILPLLPFALVAVPLTLVASHVELTYIGAQGSEFALTAAQRCLIAARNIVFYLEKLVWPSHLMFIYPRWDVRFSVLWLAYPLIVVLLALLAFLLRQRSRAPLATLLLFVGILSPALGFVNAFPFRYSFVADHFQYLASIPVITLLGAGIATLIARIRADSRALVGATAVIAIVLGILTFRQSRQYAHVETLYAATLEQNPRAWMAHLNLGVELERRGEIEAAVRHFQSAIEIYPESAESQASLGAGLQKLGRDLEARRALEQAVRLQPTYAIAHSNLGGIYLIAGDPIRAESHIRRALELKPRLTDALYNLGHVLLATHRYQEAVDAFQKTVAGDPTYVGAYNNLGVCHERLGQWQEANEAYQRALVLDVSPVVLTNLGHVQRQLGKLSEAESTLQRAIQMDNSSALTHFRLAEVFDATGRPREAAAAYAAALERAPTFDQARLALERLRRR